MRSTVWEHQTIHTKISIVKFFIVVATIIINGFTAFRFSVGNGMITPFPDKSSAHTVVFLDELEIIL